MSGNRDEVRLTTGSAGAPPPPPPPPPPPSGVNARGTCANVDVFAGCDFVVTCPRRPPPCRCD
eukprot:6341106-Prymnesium_polylepis.2